uniref:BRISC and BRCA1-A complex member 2 n=1 Tax=Leersia perrieri TaxID=77586 RepID=A0A0D9WU59_9ORYZ
MSPPAAALASISGAPLAPLVAAQLNFVLSQSKLPIKVGTQTPASLPRFRFRLRLTPLSALCLQVGQIWSGCRDGRYADRFTLAIPFCLDYVYCNPPSLDRSLAGSDGLGFHVSLVMEIAGDFLYNALSPKVAPDVVFGPDDEGFQPLLGYDETGNGEKSCLANWDCRDSGALLDLIKELRELYIEYQKKQAAEVDDARLKFEISTVLSKEPDEVKFAVPLVEPDLDFAKLVPGCPWKLPQKIHLQAVFPITRSYSSVPSAPLLKLVSTPDLKSFFSVDDVKLPPWLDGMCMAEYLPNLEENLKIQVVDASASIGSRRRFIEALAPTFGRPLEADPVHFVIPLQFPKQQPVITLQSTQVLFRIYTFRVGQHFNAQGAPIMSAPVNDYPWSPRWDVTQMVERIFDFLVDECQTFKKFCSDSLPHNRSS